MKSYLILLPVLLLSLFQGSFLGFNLVLLVVIFYTILKQDKQSLYVALFSGLILDLSKGHLVGLSALIFLLFSYLLILYSYRFSATHWLFLVVFVAISSTLYSFLFYGFFDWKEVLVLVLITLLTRFVLMFLPLEIDKRDIRLKR